MITGPVGLEAFVGTPANSSSGTFMSLWNTANTSTGSSASNQVSLPLESTGTYDFTVHWGDGTSNTITAWDDSNKTHTYPSTGTYRIDITGLIRGWRFNNGGDRLKLTDILSWGPLQPGSSGGYFFGCGNLDISAVDILDIEATTNLDSFFRGCTVLSTPSMDGWHTSRVTSMREVFYDCPAFNSPIGSWDLSNVTRLDSMFFGAASFNQDLNLWDVGAVQNMFRTFYSATSFNGAIGSWRSPLNTSLQETFYGATSFNQDLWQWETGAVTTMISTFQNASVFDGSLSQWDTSLVGSMENMFNGASAFSQSISSFNFVSVGNLVGFMANRSTKYPTHQYGPLLGKLDDAPSLQSGVTLDMGSANYSTLYSPDRASIISKWSWIINDGGAI